MVNTRNSVRGNLANILVANTVVASQANLAMATQDNPARANATPLLQEVLAIAPTQASRAQPVVTTAQISV